MANAGDLTLTLEFHNEGRKWSAHCKELGTATFGHSLRDAQERIIEAVSVHLNTLEDFGELDKFFKKHQITNHSRDSY
jgi:predicted RNase H-like HicB family nuclease